MALYRIFLLVFSLLAGASSQNLAFVTNAGEGRYTFQYNEYAVVDGVVISDSLPPGLFSVTCLLDSQPSTNISYSLEGRDGLFQVDPSTGALSLLDGMELDYEVMVDIQFSVTCSAPSAARDGTAQVDFSILPVNEFPPVLSTRTLFANIRENLAIGTVLVSTRNDVNAIATFSATDEDDGPDGALIYTLTFNENLTSFSVDENSGTLRVTQNLDVDNTPFGFAVETIRLTVCDINPAVPFCPNVEFSLVITSANDNNPVFEQNAYEVSVLENVPSGFIIANVSCTDADVGAGEFENVTSSLDLFNVTLQPSEQVISLSGTLDFETARSHNVSLICSDFAGGIARASLMVTVDPVNDNRPRFTNDVFSFTMSRLLTTGNQIGTVVAIDEDEEVGDDLTYTLMENENFQIQSDGAIILSDFVYVVEGQVFELPVTVSDGEFSDTATVVITVNGVLSVPEVILTCVGVLIFLVLVIFVIVFCCYCSVCCSRLIPKQRHVDVPVYKNENAMPDGAMMAAVPIPMPIPIMGGMYDQGKGPTYMMAMPHWGSESIEEEASEEEDVELGSIATASSRVYSPTPYLKEMVEMFKEGDAILEGKKSKKK